MPARRPFAVEEDFAMSQRMLRRIVTAGALAALLALSLPAPAGARELGGTGGMLRWLKSFWENGISALWPSAAAGEEGQPAAKAGPGIDPNGKPAPPPVTPSGAMGDEGPGIDPNG
jgi:hypothetical protein